MTERAVQQEVLARAGIAVEVEQREPQVRRFGFGERERIGLRREQQLWRLLLVTGFLGGLTTFSAFSAESLALLQRGQPGWALAHSLLHVGGALAAAAAGAWLARSASG